MKTFKLFSVVAFLAFFVSCGENENKNRETEEENLAASNTTQEVPDPNEVIDNWGKAWSSNDTTGVKEMIASDATLVLNGNEFPQDSINAWSQVASSQMRDLNLKSIKKGSTDNIAFDTGTYTHSQVNDTTQRAGSYTFIWERSNEENDWKVKVMNISEVQPIGFEVNNNK